MSSWSLFLAGAAPVKSRQLSPFAIRWAQMTVSRRAEILRTQKTFDGLPIGQFQCQYSLCPNFCQLWPNFRLEYICSRRSTDNSNPSGGRFSWLESPYPEAGKSPIKLTPLLTDFSSSSILDIFLSSALFSAYFYCTQVGGVNNRQQRVEKTKITKKLRKIRN